MRKKNFLNVETIAIKEMAGLNIKLSRKKWDRTRYDIILKYSQNSSTLIQMLAKYIYLYNSRTEFLNMQIDTKWHSSD